MNPIETIRGLNAFETRPGGKGPLRLAGYWHLDEAVPVLAYPVTDPERLRKGDWEAVGQFLTEEATPAALVCFESDRGFRLALAKLHYRGRQKPLRSDYRKSYLLYRQGRPNKTFRQRWPLVEQAARVADFGMQSVGDGLEPVSFAEALETFKAPPEEPRLEMSEAFWPAYRKLEEGLQEERAAWPTGSSEQRLLNVINTLISQKTLPEEDLRFLHQVKKDLLGPRRLPRAFVRQALAATPEPLTPEAKLDRLRGVLEQGRRWYGGLLEEAPRPEPVALVVALEVRCPTPT